MCNLIMGLPKTESTATATRAAGGKLPKKNTKKWKKARKNYSSIKGFDYGIPISPAE